MKINNAVEALLYEAFTNLRENIWWDATYNSLALHKLYIQYFHPVSYEYAVCFGLRPSSGILIQKYSHEEET